MIFVSQGPSPSGWIGQYYLCPLCGYYVDRNKYDECECGNITIDVDYCRISVNRTPHCEVKVFNASRKKDDK